MSFFLPKSSGAVLFYTKSYKNFCFILNQKAFLNFNIYCESFLAFLLKRSDNQYGNNKLDSNKAAIQQSKRHKTSSELLDKRSL